MAIAVNLVDMLGERASLGAQLLEHIVVQRILAIAGPCGGLPQLTLHIAQLTQERPQRVLRRPHAHVTPLGRPAERIVGVSPDGLNAHVVVHLFLHEGGQRQLLGLVRQRERVEALELPEREEHVRLVVAQPRDRAVAPVRVAEAQRRQAGHRHEAADLLERADRVARQVEALQPPQRQQHAPDALDTVLGDIQLA